MNGTKGIAGLSILAIAVWAFFTMSSTNAAKEEKTEAFLDVQVKKSDCQGYYMRDETDEYKACKQELAAMEEKLIKKSSDAEKRVAAATAQSDEIAAAAAAQMKTESNGEIDLEAARAARLAELPD